MSTLAQRRQRAIQRVEELGMYLIEHVEDYDKTGGSGYKRHRHLHLFDLARRYAAAMRRLSRVK